MTTSAARLLPSDSTSGRVRDLRSLAAHHDHYGVMQEVGPMYKGRPGPLVDELAAAGLRGRGGGWFPTARKLHAVVESAAARGALSSGRKPVVIGNAMEGEPASRKDAILLSHSPHLVLDGIQAAATTIGATNAFIAVHRGSALIPILAKVIAERKRFDRIPVELVTPPSRYVASEESALTHWDGDGEATPVSSRLRPPGLRINQRLGMITNRGGCKHPDGVARFNSSGLHPFKAEVLPELIHLDEWEYPVFSSGRLQIEVPNDLVGEAKRAESACPVMALRLTKE